MLRPILNKTPYELLRGNTPSISHLRVRGCRCYVHNNGKDNLGNFDARSDEAMFMGYSSTNKAYKVLNKRTRRMEESIHVVFDEKSTRDTGRDLLAEDPFPAAPTPPAATSSAQPKAPSSSPPTDKSNGDDDDDDDDNSPPKKYQHILAPIDESSDNDWSSITGEPSPFITWLPVLEHNGAIGDAQYDSSTSEQSIRSTHTSPPGSSTPNHATPEPNAPTEPAATT